MSKAMTFGEYLLKVKLARKLRDGRETYSKWTGYISDCFKDGTGVETCAAQIVRLEETNQERAKRMSNGARR